jgi:hypothetical protein
MLAIKQPSHPSPVTHGLCVLLLWDLIGLNLELGIHRYSKGCGDCTGVEIGAND